MNLRNACALAVLPFQVLIGCGDERPKFEEAAIPVRVVETTRGAFTPKLLLFGTIRPGRTYALTAGPGGTITYPARFSMGLKTGERVSSGEEVAWIENEDAHLALVEARLSVDLANKRLARTRTSFEQGIAPGVDLERDELQLKLETEKLEAAEARAKRRSVRAPDNGVLIVEHVVAPASEVKAGEELALVALEGPPRIEALAAATDRSRLEPGLTVHIRSRDGPAVEGRLVEVSGVVDDAGTVKVVADASEDEALPAPGEGVELLVDLRPLRDAVTVPEEALVFGSTNQTAVYVIDTLRFGDGLARARRVDVVVGGKRDDLVAVVSGLTSGELVVTAGAEMLGENSVVKVSREEEGQ